VCPARTGTTATATGGGGDEAEAAGGPPGWSDPVPRPQGRYSAAAAASRSPSFPVSCPVLGSGEKRGEYLTFAFGAALWVQVELEQYPTGPHIASRMLYTVSAALASCSDSDALPGFASGGKDAIFLFSGWFWGCDAGLCLWCDLRVELWNWVPVPPSATALVLHRLSYFTNHYRFTGSRLV